MSNPTRGEIIEAQIARQWAERNKTCEVSSPEIQAAADFILAHTTPPTMAEIEWDDDKHYLAEAMDRFGTTVLMLGETDGGNIRCIVPVKRLHEQLTPPDNLTPTGKRYELKEMQE